ncbi:unnamed protein product (macronuclear) [Paramecium tetraurelia]|uniref:Uncharacterized protein n=1 Tax=Paramecium tetraurelia TaxID=5888 RepID=A0D744_PARTE|nr:uncharacterized protein GSPATT00001902001 [Paramecium tetraurelia]CAK78861.1 unnamed protein product [Paramecium tetraurelia]|eukprot:XP_001446258.1 hypothetical protein (macronuclear) [Paramecium tetraurelia strain d4-2]
MNKHSGASTYQNSQRQKSHYSQQSNLPEKIRLESHGLIVAKEKEKKTKKEEIRKYLKSQNQKYIKDLY